MRAFPAAASALYCPVTSMMHPQQPTVTISSRLQVLGSLADANELSGFGCHHSDVKLLLFFLLAEDLAEEKREKNKCGELTEKDHKELAACSQKIACATCCCTTTT